MTTAQNKALLVSLEKWEGTPYMPGHRILRQGVDCVQFVTAVLCDVFDREVAVPRLSASCAMHSDASMYETLKALLSGFPSDKVDNLEPGDIVVSFCGSVKEGNVPRPHHCLIVSPDPNVLFHAINTTGVCRTAASCWFPHTIYRPRGKESWAMAD